MQEASITLDGLLLSSAKAGLSLQLENGSMPPGINGPWRDIETPVRVTAHWAILFFKGFKISGAPELLAAAKRCCEFLLSPTVRPGGRVFQCFSVSQKPKTNRLIGQAWAVEPLLVIGGEIEDERLIHTATEVLSVHPYSNDLHGWYDLELGGKVLSFNRTVNQQVWFATMAIIAGKYNLDLRERAEDFFSSLYRGVTFLELGLIRHRYHPAIILKYPELSFLRRVSALLKRAPIGNRHQNLNALSTGYQAFLLYSLALAEETSPGAFFAKESANFAMIQEAIHFVVRQFPHYQNGNKYAWPYNPVGIEMAYVLKVFGGLLGIAEYDELACRWLNLQVAAHYNFDSGFMERNSSDPLTLAARLYEATRLSDYRIDLFGDSGSKR